MEIRVSLPARCGVRPNDERRLIRPVCAEPQETGAIGVGVLSCTLVVRGEAAGVLQHERAIGDGPSWPKRLVYLVEPTYGARCKQGGEILVYACGNAALLVRRTSGY